MTVLTVLAMGTPQAVVCCAPNIVGTLILLLVAAVTAVLLLAALVLAVVGAVQRRRSGGARGKRTLRAAAIFAGAGVAVPLLALFVVWLRGDPGTLRMDLRDHQRASMLEKDPLRAVPATWQYESDRVELRLPDGRELDTEVVNTLFHAEGEKISDLEIRGPAESVTAAERRVRSWGTQLEARHSTLEDNHVATNEWWRQTTRTKHLTIELSLQPVREGALAIARARVEFR